MLTHFNRTHCWPDVDDTTACIREISLKDSTDLRLLAYGYGDGGGGPTPGMIETQLRSSHMDGLPEIESMTVSHFMHELEEQKADLPVYNDELYLELHRGTLTQMHDVKRDNRKAEFALRDMEYFNVLSGEKRNENADKWLKILLKNQFHDILPGTCITPVYDLYRVEMTKLIADYRAAAADYAKKLTAGEGVTLFNTLSFDRSDVCVIENAPGFAKGYPSQRYTDVMGRDVLAVGGVKLEGFGAAALDFAGEAVPAASPFVYTGDTLETPFASIRFDEDGYIASFIDKQSGRELRRPGGDPLGVLLFGEDVPAAWDNWDLDRDVVRNVQPVKAFGGRTVVTDGAVEIRLRSVYTAEKTKITVDMVCYADSPRVDFHAAVDWNTPHRLLKVGFDLDIAAKEARSEIQYGSILRPTTENLSTEYSKFEVCNYKYTDISEPHFGAAVLNDCKYGIAVTGGNLRLSLHRGGTHPDFTGDCGVHEMTWALLPHNGAFAAENTVYAAYELNVPVFVSAGKASVAPIVKTDKANILVESVKPAEDGDGYVLRMYECEGANTKASLSFGKLPASATLTNLLEDPVEALDLVDGKLPLTFRPFEIKTVKIR